MTGEQVRTGFARAPVGLRVYCVLIWTTPLVGLVHGLGDSSNSVAVLLTTELLLALVGIFVLRALIARRRWAWWLSLIAALFILIPVASEHYYLWLAPLGLILLACLTAPSSRPVAQPSRQAPPDGPT